ncbi:MAG: SCO family protein [Pirellulales bacterium]|nr:SCO family protein [Pirellulales bacterium]
MNRRQPVIPWMFVVSVTIAAIASSAAPAADPEQRKEPLPEELRDVGVTEHLDSRVPGELKFIDSQGSPVDLGQLFDGKRPVVLTLNYSNCPMLCSLQLNGLFDALGRMTWDIGNQFEMITVSIDPLETPQRAEMTKLKYLKTYRRAGAAGGYHCLTGREEDIRKLADAVGFHYKYSAEDRQYLHAAVTMILTPDGRVSRYLYGVQYDPQTLRLSLLEAGEGKIGSTVDQILLFCFHYDAEKGRYGPAAFRLMQLGGGLTVMVLAGAVWVFRRRERAKARARASEETP